MMKAWILRGIGDIGLEETALPSPGLGEVRLRVGAAGICGSDIPRIFVTGAHRMPLVPGHECSGVVESLGEGVDPCWMGKRVGVFPLIPCGKCGPCRAGHPELCRKYGYVGSRRDGAFAEYVTVPATNLLELPAEVSYEAAAMIEPMAVAVHAMRMAVEDGGRTVGRDAKTVVCGLGTVGLLLVMFLLERGFHDLYVIGNREGQRKRAEALGIPADRFCNSAEVDAAAWILERTGGAEMYFECVGSNESLSYGIHASAPGAGLVLLGNPRSDMALPRDVYWRILRNQLTVRGTWNSTFLAGGGPEGNPDDWHYVLSRLLDGSVQPEKLITHRLGMDVLDRGFRIMRDKTEDYCKVMLVL